MVWRRKYGEWLETESGDNRKCEHDMPAAGKLFRRSKVHFHRNV